MIKALDLLELDEFKAWLKLKQIMDEAFTYTPDWQPIPDYKAMLSALQLRYKMKNKGPDTVINVGAIFPVKEL